MIRDLFDSIKQGQDVRQNLIKLKAELKEEFQKTSLLYYMGGDYSILEELLTHEDAKVRKNAALIMGELKIPAFLHRLYHAYEVENQLFVKSAYLTALKGFDYTNLLPALKERWNDLNQMEIEESNKKHIQEELRCLSELIIAKEGMEKHEFTGYDVPSKMVLLTNRNFKNITLDQLKGIQAKEFNAGILLKTDHLEEILWIRTYSELLFILDDLKTCRMNVEEAADAIAGSSLIEFLNKRHKGKEPYYFRIELKSKLPLDKKSTLAKKLGTEITRRSNQKLVNSASNYEFELRLIENKEGNFNVLVKLYTLKDERFLYRKNTIAASIQPVNAAFLAELAKEYMKEDAQVLDPFCGVGTMLIERNYLVQANTMYGLDIYADAIQKGQENTKEAHAIIHYINRDFFDFKHEYLFDEIFTNMPRAIGHKEEDEIFRIYRRFFEKAPEHLKHEGVIIMYTHNRDYVKKLAGKNIYSLEAEYEISKKEGAYLMVLRYMDKTSKE
ncbi:TRM11 family SAM-dependent methyltransferase [Anaerocolumna sp.]|uniref:TRM11 family SAM-dependent methyltransferase n=1 Tax=Anaerocolumna sp. TaxID=2041569 RepID=UPI0028AF1F2C|nr:methyltransferase [Anaerocolumna sp.]